MAAWNPLRGGGRSGHFPACLAEEAPPASPSAMSMEGVCVNTILQEFIVNIVLHSITISPGKLQMAKQEPQMNANPVSAMDILTLATLTWTHGWHQGTKVAESVIIVSTIQKAGTASIVSQATTGTSKGLFLPLTAANCVPVTLLDQQRFPLATAPSVIPAMVTVPANLVWLVLNVINAWLGTGDLDIMAANHVIVQEVVTH
uniref:Uncharacterized protein n=1 Tax=Sphaerodactylus townsendi TaxID=933632 RepID=A0ACB8FP85_9SAUR